MDPISAPAAPSAPTAAPEGGAPGGAAPAAAPSTVGVPAQARVGQPQGVPGAAPGPGATKAERIAYKRAQADGTVEEIDISDYLHPVKVNGKEVRVPISEMAENFQFKRASMQRFEQAAREAKAVEDQKARLQRAAQMLNDPERLFDHLENTLGDRAYDALAQRLKRLTDYRNLPPQERARLEEMQKRERTFREQESSLQQREARIKAAEAAAVKQRGEALAAKWQQEWPGKLAALGLPNNDFAMKMAMRFTRDELKRSMIGKYALTEDQAMSEAVKQVRGMLGESIKALDPGSLRALAGDEAIAKFASTHQAAIDQQPGREVPQDQPAIRDRQPMPREDYGDVLERLRRSAPR